MTIADAQALWEPAGHVPQHGVLRSSAPRLRTRRSTRRSRTGEAGGRAGSTGASPARTRAPRSRGSSARRRAVAIGPNVSSMIGVVASAIPDDARVLVPDVEFTSLLFPFLVQQQRGVTVTLVPPRELAGAIDRDVDIVAFSAVQMATGEVADLDGIAAAAAEHEVVTIVDATQAVGWLPLDASRFDVVVAHAYKWMMSPRGTAFMAVEPGLLETVVPDAAGWYAGDDPLADVLRRSASPRGERAAARHVARLVHVGRRRPPRSRSSRRSASTPSTTTTSLSRTGSAPGSGSSRATRRSSSATSKAPPRSSSAPTSARPSAAAGCGRRGTSTTRTPTSTRRSTSSQAERAAASSSSQLASFTRGRPCGSPRTARAGRSPPSRRTRRPRARAR